MKHLSCCLAVLIFALATYCQVEVVTINAQPPVYLKFTNPPFTANGRTFVPLAEVTNELKMDQPISLKGLIVLKNDLTRKDIVFAPARAIANELKLNISRDDNYLSIGALT